MKFIELIINILGAVLVCYGAVKLWGALPIKLPPIPKHEINETNKLFRKGFIYIAFGFIIFIFFHFFIK